MTAAEAHASDAEADLAHDAEWRDRIDQLTRRNRVERRGDLALALLDAREQLAAALCAEDRAPSELRQPGPGGGGDAAYPPELDARDLTVERLAAALHEGDCLLVRGLFSPSSCERLREDIDRAFADCIDAASGTTVPGVDWYKPFELQSTLQYVRDWLFSSGALMAADSPMGFFDLIEALTESGVMDVLTEYFGQRPITSVDKTTLRRVYAGQGSVWHQDSAFMGQDYPAVNVWVSLSDTSESPTLEIVQGPLGRIVETGTQDARYDWSVGPGVIEGLGPDHPVISPSFRPGDGLIFNGLLLHRAEPVTSGAQPRYATESWFFAAAAFPPQQQVPLAY